MGIICLNAPRVYMCVCDLSSFDDAGPKAKVGRRAALEVRVNHLSYTKPISILPTTQSERSEYVETYRRSA